MTMTIDAYPKTVKLPDGSDVEVRALKPDDGPAIVDFARALAPQDLLFLRVDLTQEEVVAGWIANAAEGRSSTILAWAAEGLVGYATVHRNPAPWTRGVGEIRVNVGASHRGRGLGRVLTGQVFDIAHDLGLRKLMA